MRLILLVLMLAFQHSFAQSSACAYQHIELHVKKGIKVNPLHDLSRKDIVHKFLHTTKDSRRFMVSVKYAAPTSYYRQDASAFSAMAAGENDAIFTTQDILSREITENRRAAGEYIPAFKTLFRVYTQQLIYTITLP